MFMRLIRRADRKRLGIAFNQIESPFFAVSKVRNARMHSGHIRGVDDLLRVHGRFPGRLSSDDLRRIATAVGDGDWLLVTNEPSLL